MESCITFQAWVYIGAHTCIHTAQIFFSEQDLTSLTKPHQVFKRDGIKRQNNYLVIKFHNCIFCDNAYILKSELIHDKIMNKSVLNTWTLSMLRVAGLPCQGKTRVCTAPSLSSLFSMPHFSAEGKLRFLRWTGLWKLSTRIQ